MPSLRPPWIATPAPFVVLALLMGVPATAHATPQDLMGFGARSTALGMTGVSYSEGFESVYTNPAGLGANGRMQLMVGLASASFQLQIDGQQVPLDASQGLMIGVQLPLPFGGVLEDTLTLGAGLFTPSNAVLRTDVRFHQLPQWSVLERSQVVAIQVGMGVSLERLVPGLRLGLGVSGLAQLEGTLDVFLDDSGAFQTLTEVQLVTTFAPIVGVQYRSEHFLLGLTYRAEIKSEIVLDVTVSNLPVPVPVLEIDALAHFDPHSVAVEGTWRPIPGLSFIANLTWRRWSTWPGPAGNTTALSEFPPAPGFRDTFSPRVGVEWTTTRGGLTGSVRGGFAFEQTPAPAAQERVVRDSDGSPLPSNPNIPTSDPVLEPVRYLDANRYVVTAGFGFVWQTPIEPRIRVDFFGQLHRMQRRTHDVPNVGGMSRMETQGLVLALGWTGGLEW